MFAHQLAQLGQWMGANDLLDAGVQERLERLEQQVRSDKVTVAFVGEFSRGKSELINGILFAGYGRRLMPASAGRTPMGATRLQASGVAEWRLRPGSWVRLALNMDDPEQMARTLEKLSEMRSVPLQEARALGFWSDGADGAGGAARR